MKGRYPRGRLAALVCALWVLPLVAAAATPPVAPEKTPTVELPQPLTRDAIRELVARLSDGEVRELLLAQLDKVAVPAADQEAAPPATGLAARMDRARTEIGAVLRSWREVPAALGAAVARYSEGRAPSHLLLVAALFVVMVSLGWVAERLAGRLLAGVRGRLDRRPGDGLGVDAGSLLIRVVLDLLLLAVFVATVFAGFLALFGAGRPRRPRRATEGLARYLIPAETAATLGTSR